MVAGRCWVDSRRAHSVQPQARAGSAFFAEPHSPYTFHGVPPAPLDACERLVTWDSERAGADAGPALFKHVAQQHQQRMRTMGLESEHARERRAAPYITVQAPPARGVKVYVATDARVAQPLEWLIEGRFERLRGTQLRVERKSRMSVFGAESEDRRFDVWGATFQERQRT